MCVNQNQLYTKTIYYTSFLSSLFYGIRASSLVRALSIQQPWLPKTPPKSLLYSLEKTRSTYFACHSRFLFFIFILFYFILFFILSEPIVSFMFYATTARDAWNYLVRRFATRSLSKIIYLKGIFTSIT